MYYNTKQSRAQSISLPRKISCLARVRFPFIQNRLRLQSFRQESLYPRYKSDRIKTPSENKLFRIVFKVVKYNVFFAFEIAVKRGSSNARFFSHVGNAYFFEFVFVHKFEQRLHYIKLCVFVW